MLPQILLKITCSPILFSEKLQYKNIIISIQNSNFMMLFKDEIAKYCKTFLRAIASFTYVIHLVLEAQVSKPKECTYIASHN